MYYLRYLLLAFFLVTLGCASEQPHASSPLISTQPDSLAFAQAGHNALLASEGFRRSRLFIDGWLAHADPATGLIPRNLTQSRDIWNAKDAAADNYPFMVLTAALTDRPLFEGRMTDMLKTEIRLTSRIGALPDTYSFSKKTFDDAEPDLGRILFGTSEYIKDGLLPLTEWLGPSPWSDRMIAMLDDAWSRAPVQTKWGAILSENVELNGEMLQVLARVYWMTGDEKYLDWAIRLGDYYLFGNNHPTRDRAVLRLRDHGCEVVSGLTELYATLHFTRPNKKQQYQPLIHEMLDRILEVGRNEDGLFYNQVNPQSGELVDAKIADNFGYTLNGFYTVYLLNSIEAYRQATRKALQTLDAGYRSYAWEGESADGYADAIKDALNLYTREPVPETVNWLDSEIQVMWDKQQPDGVIEGWHGDGNFARTSLMYSLWKTQGTHLEPWRADVKWGAVQKEEALYLHVQADSAWAGVLKFDTPRHQSSLHLPLDWPRINQFPEWFTVDENRSYTLKQSRNQTTGDYAGTDLSNGIPLSLAPGESVHLRVE